MRTPESKTEYAMPEAGVHNARLIWLIDLGTQPSANPAYDPTRKVRIGFELVDTEFEFDGVKKPFMVSTEVTFSRHEKSRLYQIAKSWLGVDLQKTKDFDWNSVLGKAALVTVEHTQSGDKTYANIANIGGVPKGILVKEPFNNQVSLSLEKSEFDAAAYNFLPDKIKEKIASSPEGKVCLQ